MKAINKNAVDSAFALLSQEMKAHAQYEADYYPTFQAYKDGALQMSRVNAISIAKTAINHLQATVRNQFTEANKNILKGKQWLSTLDNKTSHTCIVRDRLKYTLDGKIEHKVPYLQGLGKIHFSCRSTETLNYQIMASAGYWYWWDEWRRKGIDGWSSPCGYNLCWMDTTATRLATKVDIWWCTLSVNERRWHAFITVLYW